MYGKFKKYTFAPRKTTTKAFNRLKLPNITGRENWNYVKTVSCNFSGNDIPQTDLQTIRNMFDNGVTLWHNPSTIYNYNNSNNIV